MNDNVNSTKNKLSYIMNRLTRKEKIIWLLQMTFTITILVLAVLGLKGILSIYLTNTIDLILLILLFIIGGVRLVTERIVYAIIYFVLAVLMCGILIASFFI